MFHFTKYKNKLRKIHLLRFKIIAEELFKNTYILVFYWS